MQYRPITPQDTAKNIWVLLAFLGITLVLLLAVVVVHVSPVFLFLFLVIALFALTTWSIGTYGFECPACRHRFEIGLATALATPHLWDKKLLRCPSCGVVVWAQAVIKVPQPK